VIPSRGIFPPRKAEAAGRSPQASPCQVIKCGCLPRKQNQTAVESRITWPAPGAEEYAVRWGT